VRLKMKEKEKEKEMEKEESLPRNGKFEKLFS